MKIKEKTDNNIKWKVNNKQKNGKIRTPVKKTKKEKLIFTIIQLSIPSHNVIFE